MQEYVQGCILDGMFVFPSNLYVEIITPIAIVVAGGAIEK